MRLIGQAKLNQFIDNVTLESCPHFIILTGASGCGKTTATEKLAEKLGVEIVKFEHKVEEVRHIIDTIYSVKQPIMYVCDRLDDMSISAKNSLLKVTEETPKFAYIVLHAKSGGLATLKSRAQLFQFEPYSFSDFEQFCEGNNIKLNENRNVMFNCCRTFGELKYYADTGKFDKAYELANMVLDYITEVTTVNAFKILNRLALKKDDQEGIEPQFFLTVLLNTYLDRQGDVVCGDVIVVSTIEALSQLRNEVLSKSAIMDSWVLKMMRGIDKHVN